MPLFKKVESSLGVDIGAGGMKLVELRKTKNRPQLWTYGILDQPLDVHAPVSTSVPEDPKQARITPVDPRVTSYAELLRTLVKESRVTTKHVTASLPVSQVFHAVVTLPPVPEKEIEYHVRAKVTKMLPQPIDDMQVVHQVLPKKKDAPHKDIKVLVTAASKQLIRFYTDIFSHAGLLLDELETEAFAIERSLVGRDMATVMVVDIGAERTNFFIVDEGQPVTHRSIQVGGHAIDRIIQDVLGLDPATTAQVKFDLSRASRDIPEEMFATVSDPVIKEIQYGFELYLHQTGNEQKRPEKIILTGGGALFPPLLHSIGRAFEIKVFVGDPWARTVYQQGLKPMLDGIGPRMGVAIGLALHRILPPRP